MCGHVGFIGNHTHARAKAFLNMLYMDVVRGEDSTGVCLVKPDLTDLAVFKDVGPPNYLLLDTKINHAVKNWPRAVAIGHNRAATRGRVTETNAHPFICGRVVGAHNGTITLSSKSRLIDGVKFDTDSEAIFNSIDKKGIAWTWAQIDGAATLVWWDRNKKQLKIISNCQRPFFFTYTKSMDGFFWASEDWILEAALKRNHIEFGTIYQPNADYLFTIKYKNGKVKKQSTKLKPYEKPPYIFPNNQVSSKSTDKANKTGSKAKEDGRLVTVNDLFDQSNKDELLENQRAIDQFRQNFDHIEWSDDPEKQKKETPKRLINGAYYTEDEFTQHYHLCAWCQGALDFDDPDIEFFDMTTAMHGGCNWQAWENYGGTKQ